MGPITDWRVGDVVMTRAGGRWTRQRDTSPQWDGPVGGQATDAEVTSSDAALIDTYVEPEGF